MIVEWKVPTPTGTRGTKSKGTDTAAQMPATHRGLIFITSASKAVLLPTMSPEL
jgi:hypothetical protein